MLYVEVLCKYASAMLLAVISIFAPISPLIFCVVLFIGVDFITGVWASHKTAKRDNKIWFFRSCEAWRTLYKLGFTIIAISMAWIVESYVIDFVDIKLAKLFAGFVCGVELWSFLENATMISDAPYFLWMRRYLHRRIEQQTNGLELNISDSIVDIKKGENNRNIECDSCQKKE